MNRRLRIYYMAVLGALGGLLGWWIVGSFPTSTWNIWLAYPFVGAGLGLCIGACIAATEGALVKRVPARALHDALLGAAGGAVAGLVGLLLAEVWFLGMGGGLVARVLGWMLLGGFVGLADLLVNRQIRRGIYGAIGGLLGGAIGGLLYEGLTQLFLAESGRTQVVVGGLGLMLLGACIGGLIPLARQVLSRGALHVLTGTQAGLVCEVTDSATIGSYDGCDVYLPDGGVAWRHATVRRTARGFVIEIAPEAAREVAVGDVVLQPGHTAPLRGGERIQLGEATLAFMGR